MKNRILILAALIAFLVGIGGIFSQASATILKWGPNDMFFEDAESLFRHDPGLDGDYGTSDDFGKWLAPGPATPPQTGDHFFGVINLQHIKQGGTPDHWNQVVDGYISGIFSQRIEATYLPTSVGGPGDPYDAAQTAKPHIILGTPTLTKYKHPGLDLAWGTADDQSVDISSLLNVGAGEMMALYQEGPGGTPYETDGTMSDDVSKATSGSLWLSAGISAGLDGFYGMTPGPDGFLGTGDDVFSTDDNSYFYSHSDVGVLLKDFFGEAFAGMDSVVNNTGWTFLPVNDPAEGEIDLLYMALGNDLYFNNEITPNSYSILNPEGWTGSDADWCTAPWDFLTNDPAHVNAVPEPCTMLLLGTGLIGLGGFARRRFKKFS